MDNAKDQLVEKLGTATNILVTVSRDPSVDQLAACLGLTLLLNKFGKHATAVFSGTVPSTLEFLEPEHTLEKTTDSLRDFIIALDKSKADKLRYKVEDEMVRIFITPYHTSLSSKDLEFSQGDFNIDVVIALGVNAQEDFDEAITAHGRILHDAVVSSITTVAGGELGSINWIQPAASSLSELIVDLSHALAPNLIDGQIATSLLTGIVSETARFSNDKTTPLTMSVSAELMAAGANQQLVASKLDEPASSVTEEVNDEASEVDEPTDQPEPQLEVTPKTQDGTLEIDHEAESPDDEPTESPAEPDGADEAATENDEPAAEGQVTENEDGSHELVSDANPTDDLSSGDNAPATLPKTSTMIFEPPSMGGQLTANSQPETLDPAVNPLNEVTGEQPALLNRSTNADIELPQPTLPVPAPPADTVSPPILTGFTPPPPAWVPPANDGPQFDPANFSTTSPTEFTAPAEPAKTDAPVAETVDDARDEVLKALNSEPAKAEPVQALGAQPLGEPLRPLDPPIPAVDAAPSFTSVLQQAIPATPVAAAPAPLPLPPAIPLTDAALPVPPAIPTAESVQAPPTVTDPTAPPPVPPPIPFNFGSPTS